MYLFATCKFWLRADRHPMAIYIHLFTIARGHAMHIILFLVSSGARISSWEGKDDNSKKKMTELGRTMLAYVQIIASSCCSLVYVSEIILDIGILKEIKNQCILTNQYQANSSSKVELTARYNQSQNSPADSYYPRHSLNYLSWLEPGRKLISWRA